jgi:hypothetical protein
MLLDRVHPQLIEAVVFTSNTEGKRSFGALWFKREDGTLDRHSVELSEKFLKWMALQSLNHNDVHTVINFLKDRIDTFTVTSLHFHLGI